MYDENLQDQNEVCNKNWNKMSTTIHQEGFREGVEDGRKENYQKGFDIGYRQGFSVGFSQGAFNGALKTLKSVPSFEKSIQMNHLELLSNPNKAMCQICINSNYKTHSIEEIQQWQLSVANSNQHNGQYQRLNNVIGYEVIKNENKNS